MVMQRLGGTQQIRCGFTCRPTGGDLAGSQLIAITTAVSSRSAPLSEQINKPCGSRVHPKSSVVGLLRGFACRPSDRDFAGRQLIAVTAAVSRQPGLLSDRVEEQNMVDAVLGGHPKSALR